MSTASGRLMFQIIGAMAEFERELIRERVKAGMKNARAEGAHIGRPRANVNVAEITRLRDQGASWRAIVLRFDAMQPSNHIPKFLDVLCRHCASVRTLISISSGPT
jgi:DNA invertase Pin-like site-specific DNA recombinase